MVNPLHFFINSLNGFGSYVNDHYFRLYLKEVESDIYFMGERMNLHKPERNNDKFFIHLFNKYDTDYCPSNYYLFFSEENKERYSKLREEIDELLIRKNDLSSEF